MLEKKIKIPAHLTSDFEALMYETIDTYGKQAAHQTFSELLFKIAQYLGIGDVMLSNKKGTVVFHQSTSIKKMELDTAVLINNLDTKLNHVVAGIINFAGTCAALQLLADVVFTLSLETNMMLIDLNSQQGSLYILN